MSDTDSIEAASRRLTQALDALDEAAERRRETDRAQQALANQVHALDNDRARLAGELDHATARTRALETTNREVAQRIDQAIATIRGALGDTRLTVMAALTIADAMSETGQRLRHLEEEVAAMQEARAEAAEQAKAAQASFAAALTATA